MLQKHNMVKSAAGDARVWERYPGAPQGGAATTRPGDARLPDRRRRPRSTAPTCTRSRTSTTTTTGTPARRSRPSPVPFEFALLAVRARELRRGAPVRVGSPRGDADREPRAERRPGLLPGQPVPRPPGGGADRLHRGPGSVRRRRPADPADARRREHGPDSQHLNNANMLTPPDGRSPVMQMYLWAPDRLPRRQRRRRRVDPLPRVHARALEPARHRRRRRRRAELAAGRGDGRGLERLVREGLHRQPVPATRHGGAGRGRHGRLHRRRAALDPRARRSTARSAARPRRVPGGVAAGAGGFTYGDFGRVDGAPEVHGDGEIWAQTLWDLRDAIGSVDARRLITQGMRLSPPEPSFLDMRNAILQADAAEGGTRRDADLGACSRVAEWASSPPPTARSTRRRSQDFSTPPAAGGPRGRDHGHGDRRRDRAAGRRREGGDRRARRTARTRSPRRRGATAPSRSTTCPRARLSRASSFKAPGYDRSSRR